MSALLVSLDGATTRVSGRFSVLALGTLAEGPLLLQNVTQTRQAADQLAALIQEAGRPLGVRVSNAGRLVLIEAVDDVSVRLDTDDLVSVETEVDPRTRLSSRAHGTRYRSDGIDTHDREVIDNLADMVGALGRTSAAENRLGGLAVDAMAAAGPPSATRAAPLAAAAQRLLTATAAATVARTDQLDAIEQKEREAKGGGAPGQPGGPAAGGPAPGGTMPAPTPAGGGGGAPAGGGGDGPGSEEGDETRPGEPVAPGEEEFGRPADSDQDYEAYKTPCEVRTYKLLGGVVVTVGLFVGGEDGEGTWYVAKGQYDLDRFTPDGPEIIPDSYDFGVLGAADPDIRAEPIDIAVLDELAERQRQQLAQQSDPWADFRSFASFLADLVPVLGTVKSGLELLTGYDYFAGRDLTPAELAVVGVGILLPFAGGAVKAAAKGVLESTQRLIRSSQTAVDLTRLQRDALDDAFEAFRTARRARGEPKVMIQSKQCQKTSPRTGSGGLSRLRVRCFPAGTPVRIGDGPRVAIEDVRPGGRVVRTHRGAATELVELRIADHEGTAATLRPTPFHLIATGEGFVPAAELRRGDRVALAGGRAGWVVERRTLTGRWPVHNLTIDGAYTYYASELDVLVHNTCDCTEFISQQTAEGILERDGFEFLQKNGSFANTRNPKTFAPEPEFTAPPNAAGTHVGQVGEFTGRAGRQKNGAQIRKPARDSTRPDIYGIEDGVRVAYEIKTIPSKFTVLDFFRKYKATIRNQIGGRIGNMTGLGVEHRLMIDIRNIERLDDLSGVLNNLRALGSRSLPDLTQYAGGVRFLQNGPGGGQLSRIYSWSEILQ